MMDERSSYWFAFEFASEDFASDVETAMFKNDITFEDISKKIGRSENWIRKVINFPMDAPFMDLFSVAYFAGLTEIRMRMPHGPGEAESK